MDIPTGDAQSVMVVPNCLLIRRVEQADHMTFPIMVQTMLVNSKLVAFAGICSRFDLRDGFRRKYQIVMNIVKERHNASFRV